jgi:hypothetical protein
MMPESLYVLVLLACPLGMGLMMLAMMTGGRRRDAARGADSPRVEIARLRAEVEELRQQRINEHAASADASVSPDRGQVENTSGQ